MWWVTIGWWNEKRDFLQLNGGTESTLRKSNIVIYGLSRSTACCCCSNCISSRLRAFVWLWSMSVSLFWYCCCSDTTNLIRSEEQNHWKGCVAVVEGELPSFVDDCRSSDESWSWASWSISSVEDFWLNWNELSRPDIDEGLPFWLRSCDERVGGKPLDGPDVHGEDGQVAGERNLLLGRALKANRAIEQPLYPGWSFLLRGRIRHFLI